MRKLCSSEDIQYLNDRYEYRVMAVSIMDYILIESGLSDGAKTMWMILYRASGLRKDMKCEASVSYLKNRTGKSESTLWRLIRELKNSGYLYVKTREGEDGKNLPNIYGPRLPKVAIQRIKKFATPREVVSDQLGYDYITATTRDQTKEPDSVFESESNNTQPITIDTDTSQDEQKQTNLVCLEENSVNASVDDLTVSEEPYRSSFISENYEFLECVDNEIGDSVISDIQNTNPPREGYTKTISHSRDSWKMYPHIRSSVLSKLSKMNICPDQAKLIAGEIDWSLNYGAMTDWPVQKAVNVCLSLVRSGKWTTPNWPA